jgi:uncharacterized membrane protein
MKKITAIEKMLLVSLAFIIVLVIARVIITKQLMYAFYCWNLLLAIIPLLLSKWLLKQPSINIKSITILIVWLLFYPNAPYIVTDIFHLTKRPPSPLWFDLLIVVNAAWCGLMLGIASLLQVEQFLAKHKKIIWVHCFIILCLLLSGYGVYIGRYLRFNSWDIVTNPFNLMIVFMEQISNPYKHKVIWLFTLLFGCSIYLFYYTIKAFNNSIHQKIAPHNIAGKQHP